MKPLIIMLRRCS